MLITIIGKNNDVPEAVEAMIRSRLDQLAERYSFLESAHVHLGKQRNWHTAEVTFHVKGQVVRAEERADQLASAADAVLEKVDKQLNRHKGRLLQRHRAGDSRDHVAISALPLDEEPAPGDDGYEAPRVVRVKRMAIKPMSVEEAALQMELLGHDFYVFSNDESNDLNVIYRRRNGDIGLIQPE